MSALGRLGELHRELFISPWRAGLQREARSRQDALVALLFLEAMGVPNPDPYLSAELYPELVESFHDWHVRQGVEQWPEAGVCC